MEASAGWEVPAFCEVHKDFKNFHVPHQDIARLQEVGRHFLEPSESLGTAYSHGDFGAF